MLRAEVNKHSKLNEILMGYFDPNVTFLNNKNKTVSAGPPRCDASPGAVRITKSGRRPRCTGSNVLQQYSKPKKVLVFL